MTLEDLIYRRLTGSEAINNKLAKFNNNPAIFYQYAPEDTADGWNSQEQYPRIDYIVEMEANAERQTSGALILNIWGTEGATAPEELELSVRDELCNIFIQPDGQPPYSLAWVRSDVFEPRIQHVKTKFVVGITMLFDIFAFPNQETTDPDPILAINEYVKECVPQSIVIGKDSLGNFYTATNEHPVFYFRLADLQTNKETNTVVWMDGIIAGHIFAPPDSQTRLLKSLVDVLALDGEIIMLDKSPMFLQNVRADSSANALTLGQLRLYVRFGILRKPKYAHTLMKANISQGTK